MQIGNHKLDKPLFLAPMEDVSDQAFRLICKRLGCDVTVTEFTAAEALIREVPKALHKISLVDEERPVGIQLFGFRPEAMTDAAAVATRMQPDFIDINCGCWVKKHVNRLEGAGLLKDLKLFEQVVRATVAGTRLPVTVKTRLGWDENSIVILDVAKIIEQAGAKMLTLHCRTRSQAHRGLADWDWLAKVKKTISIPLVGNGDVVTPQDVKAMFATGCDGVMIGRGAVADPWIFQRSKHFLETGHCPPPPSIRERIRVCIEHLELSCRIKACNKPAVAFRKHYAGYLKNIPNISALREDLMRLEEPDAVTTRLREYCAQATDAS